MLLAGRQHHWCHLFVFELLLPLIFLLSSRPESPNMEPQKVGFMLLLSTDAGQGSLMGERTPLL